MKAIGKILGWASIAAALTLFPAASGAGTLGSMRVKLVEGDVQVKIAETGEWAPASVNMALIEGDELWVPEGGRSSIQTSNGTHIRLDRNTALQILRADRTSYQFNLSQGRAYVLNIATKSSTLQFDTPDASLRTFGNSTFRIDIPGDETDVLVFRGAVTAENAGGMTDVQAGNMLALGYEGFAELSQLPPPDDWQMWNENRDRFVLARGESRQYLPDRLQVYSSDFEENGRWVSVPEYGNVWTPTVVVAGDWAPYRHGRWVWRGGNYVWIGYEPWGWAPYHYGRWAFDVRIGWFWVPPSRGDVFWAPGYVGWVRTGDYVAWVPLAPREVYYGYGNYGRHSMNMTNVNITQVNVTNVYRNVHVANGFTVVSQGTFITGRPAPVSQNVFVNVREDFSRRRNIVVGRLPIKPVETSYVPVVRQIHDSKHPPDVVRKINVKELKQNRALVKKPELSAMRPSAKPRPLDVRKVENPKPLSERVKERRQVPPAERAPKKPVPPREMDKPKAMPPVRDVQKAAPPVKDVQKTAPPVRDVQKAAPPVRDVPKTAPPVRDVQKAAPPVKDVQKTAPPEKIKRQTAPRPAGKDKEPHVDNVVKETPKGKGDREGERKPR